LVESADEPTGHAAVRMRDVAAHCGLSESTVSHVLNGTKPTSDEARAKVLLAVEQLDYHRDSDARRLARGRSNFLGLIISDIENPFYPGLIKAFETAAVGAGFEMLLCTTNYDPDRTRNAFRKMAENKAAGVAVMTSRADPRAARDLAARGVAAVFLDAGGPGPLRADVRIEYGGGVAAAVNYLHHLGHRDFALVAGPLGRPSHDAYRAAVRAAIAAFGLTPRVVEGANDAATGGPAVQRLLTGRRLPTAVLCSNDVTAMGVARAFLDRGLRVPADVSVVGADDVPFAALTHPPLTTVRMPRERLGTLAAELLQRMLTERPAIGAEVVLETEFVIRQSTGAARPAAAGRLPAVENPAGQPLD